MGRNRESYTTVHRHNHSCDPPRLFAAKKQNRYHPHTLAKVFCFLFSFSFLFSPVKYQVRSIEVKPWAAFLTMANVPGSALLFQQILVDPRLSYFIGHAASTDHWRVHHAGSDTVDSDLVTAIVRSHGSRHLHNGSFARSVEEAGVAPHDCPGALSILLGSERRG